MDWKDGLTAATIVGLGYLGFRSLRNDKSWDGMTGSDFRKFNDTELDAQDRQDIVNYIEKSLNDPEHSDEWKDIMERPYTLQDAKEEVISQMNWFGIDKHYDEVALNRSQVERIIADDRKSRQKSFSAGDWREKAHASVIKRLNSNKDLFSIKVMKRWGDGTTTVLFADIPTIVSLVADEWGDITKVSDKELAHKIHEEIDYQPQHLSWGVVGEESDFQDDRAWDLAEPEWAEDERNRANAESFSADDPILSKEEFDALMGRFDSMTIGELYMIRHQIHSRLKVLGMDFNKYNAESFSTDTVTVNCHKCDAPMEVEAWKHNKKNPITGQRLNIRHLCAKCSPRSQGLITYGAESFSADCSLASPCPNCPDDTEHFICSECGGLGDYADDESNFQDYRMSDREGSSVWVQWALDNDIDVVHGDCTPLRDELEREGYTDEESIVPRPQSKYELNKQKRDYEEWKQSLSPTKGIDTFTKPFEESSLDSGTVKKVLVGLGIGALALFGYNKWK